MGKSRLLGDMMEYLALRHEELGLLKARAFQGDERQAFGLVRRAWFDRFQIAEDAPLAEAEAKWQERFLSLRGPGFEEAAHALGLLVGLPFRASPYIGAMRDDPAQVKGRAMVVSRELLTTLRAQVPVVLLLEDLQWADASSWEYLTKVVLEEQPGQHGMFVLATARPEWNLPDELLKYPDYQQINLTSLPDTACRELAVELLRRVEGVPDSAIQLIAERAECVPYFAEEMVNWFLDRGVIDQRSDPWRFDVTRLKESPLPATLQLLLFTRLSSLTDEERSALQCGSIFGRNFWEGGLEALGAPGRAQLLRPLQPRGFIEAQPESSLSGESEWSFHHNLLRQVTYESVLKRDRKTLHKAAAAWLEAQARRAGRLDEFVGTIGEHAERAGELTAAADWYLRAGESAKARGAFLEARTFFERALELVPPSDLEQRWRALLGRNDMAARLSENERHRASVAALLELAEGLDDTRRATAHFRHALYLDHQGDYRAAVQAFDVALAAARRASDDALGMLILGMKLICQNRLGDMNGAAATAQEVIARAYEVDEVTRARALSNLAVYYVESGNLAKAVQLHKEQAAINHRLGDRAAEANALLNLGYDYVCLGMPDAGRTALEQSLLIYRGIGVRRELDYARLNLGLAYWRSGDSHAARQLLEPMQSELVSLGDAFARAAGLSYLALAQEQSGDVADAVECFAQAMELFGTVGVQSYATDARAGLARGALAQGNLDKARELVTAIWNYLRQQGAQGIEFPVRAYLTCADIFDALGDSEMSCAAVEEGYRELIQRADKISNSDWRASFLENVPEHRAILDRWKQLAGLPAGNSTTQKEESDHAKQHIS
jgi:tetratricopeptide (TPR) repeat protein